MKSEGETYIYISNVYSKYVFLTSFYIFLEYCLIPTCISKLSINDLLILLYIYYIYTCNKLCTSTIPTISWNNDCSYSLAHSSWMVCVYYHICIRAVTVVFGTGSIIEDFGQFGKFSLNHFIFSCLCNYCFTITTCSFAYVLKKFQIFVS